MKSLIWLILALLAAPGLLSAQPSNAVATNALGPRIQFNSENYDFVKILAGQTVKYTFIATNTGDDTLEISGARGTCSCTVVGNVAGSGRSGWIPTRIAPGQSCPIPVEIATGNYAGQPITKMVTVTSNDKRRPIVNLQIHGTVWQPIELTPGMAAFNFQANASTSSTQVIKIVNQMDTPLTLSDPVCTTNRFIVSLQTNRPGQEYQLTIVAVSPMLLPPSPNPVAIQGMVSLKSSTPLRNPLEISVFETIYPEITVFPASIQLPRGPLPQALTNHITIRCTSTDISLSDPVASVPGIVMSVAVQQTDHQYDLQAVFPKDFEFPPTQPIILTVKTDDPRYPLVTVPVTPMSALIAQRRPLVPPPPRTNVLPDSIRTNAPLRAMDPPH